MLLGDDGAGEGGKIHSVACLTFLFFVFEPLVLFAKLQYVMTLASICRECTANALNEI